MQDYQAEIEAIRDQIQALQQERALLLADSTISIKNDSPVVMSEAYRRHARENPQLYAEIKGIDDAIAALQAQLPDKQEFIRIKYRKNPLEAQLEESKLAAEIHAEKINQLAAELAEEIKALKAIADEISPNYWKVYYKPFITGFNTISVPYVRSDGAVWTIFNRIV